MSIGTCVPCRVGKHPECNGPGGLLGCVCADRGHTDPGGDQPGAGAADVLLRDGQVIEVTSAVETEQGVFFLASLDRRIPAAKVVSFTPKGIAAGPTGQQAVRDLYSPPAVTEPQQENTNNMPTTINPDTMTADDLRKELDDAGVAYRSRDRKPALAAMLTAYLAQRDAAKTVAKATGTDPTARVVALVTSLAYPTFKSSREAEEAFTNALAADRELLQAFAVERGAIVRDVAKAESKALHVYFKARMAGEDGDLPDLGQFLAVVAHNAKVKVLASTNGDGETAGAGRGMKATSLDDDAVCEFIDDNPGRSLWSLAAELRTLGHSCSNARMRRLWVAKFGEDAPTKAPAKKGAEPTKATAKKAPAKATAKRATAAAKKAPAKSGTGRKATDTMKAVGASHRASASAQARRARKAS